MTIVRALFAAALLLVQPALARMPALALGVVFRIHWQALRLWLKKVPFVGARSPSPQPEAMQGTEP